MEKRGKLKRSLRYSMLDGIFASMMLGLTEQYITPFAIALNATRPQIGMLTAFPNLVASLVQLKSADVAERLKSRKRIINIFVFLHAFMYIPIILIPFIFKTHMALERFRDVSFRDTSPINFRTVPDLLTFGRE